MANPAKNPTRQLTDDLSDRIRAFHQELVTEYGLKGLRFRVGYGGGSGVDRRQNTVNGVLQIKLKTRNVDLEFEKDEPEL